MMDGVEDGLNVEKELSYATDEYFIVDNFE